MKDESSKKMIHDIRGALSVIETFLCFAKEKSDAKEFRDIHAAATRSLEKIYNSIKEYEGSKLSKG